MKYWIVLLSLIIMILMFFSTGFSKQSGTVSIITGSPTSKSIKAKLVSPDYGGKAYIAYGTSPGSYTMQTATSSVMAASACEFQIDGLNENTQYYYRLHFTADKKNDEYISDEYRFHTARSRESSFIFTVQADSHLDENSDIDLYHKTLSNILGDSPDFHVDLGDTFMVEKHSVPLSPVVQTAPDQATVNSRYMYEFSNFALLAHSAPLFLVNGNHDGELGWLADDTADNIAVWSSLARRNFFLNPVPDGFYTGDVKEEPFVGKRASWYSWNWGNALFIVLDPYWNSREQAGKDGWNITLGDAQYAWLKNTLSASTAKFRFVFIHSLTGGLDGQMRGGIEAVPFFEWGGKNTDGSDVFSQKRPGWDMPIHSLLLKYGVTAVFHGHDHLYAKQELDGIVYQEVPQPGSRNISNFGAMAEEYHYSSGTILGSSGYIRVAVSPDRVTSQYVRTWLPENENESRKNGQIDDTWIKGGSEEKTSSFKGNIILGSPTSTSIMVNVFSQEQSGQVYIDYGKNPESLDRKTQVKALEPGVPTEFVLNGLKGDNIYYYRLCFQESGNTDYTLTDIDTFRSARSAGNAFTFCIQGDSHPEREGKEFDPDLYARTLATAASDKPDFYIAMGDDFSVDTLNPETVNASSVYERYVIQRPYLGIVGRSAPVFLVNGNHEQAARYLLDGTHDNVAVWAQNARNSLYSQPAPDSFYSGNSESVPYIGLLRNYYAWTWGDALFVVIDPYWGSPGCVDGSFYGGEKRTNMWNVTIGDAQYQWLKATLEQSSAKYKFVFAHHVMGTGRGGIELADKYEWGGYNKNGRTWGFSSNRPGWASPIHQLFIDNHVTIFFQGHDHIWARQELDGVIYQTLPEPADPCYQLYNSDAFTSGDKFSNTGYTRVSVSPSDVRVDYVRTYLPADEGDDRKNGVSVFSYSVR